MFNENIDEGVLVPSEGVLKLSVVLDDLYAHVPNHSPRIHSPIEMQKLINNYGDKYTNTDKIIMLVFGVTCVKSFTLNEENISKSRVHPDDLSEQERDEKITELVCPQLVIETNVGDVVIGYDYAYVRKPTFTPNVVIDERTQKIMKDDRIEYDIDYPHISINNHDAILTLVPPVVYEDVIAGKSFIDTYLINTHSLEMTRTFAKEPFSSDGCKEIDAKSTIDVNGYSHPKNFLVEEHDEDGKTTNIFLVQQLSNDEGKLFQFIVDNHYNLFHVTFSDVFKQYICQKHYLKNIQGFMDETRDQSLTTHADEQ